MPIIFLLITCLAALQMPPLHAQDTQGETEDWRPLFDGKSLDGWVNVNCAPSTWTVREGMIHCTGIPTGALRTVRQYENFVLEFEWRHLVAAGNAGLFVWAEPISAPGVPFLRAIEVQILDHAYGKSDWFTTHGDIFPIHGSTMIPDAPSRGSRSFPSEMRSKASPEWNHYRVTCLDGVIQLAVNGKEVSGGKECVYRKGYIALESEGGQVDYRNIRIKELPSSSPVPSMVAPLDQGFTTLYNGVNLDGWVVPVGSEDHWRAQDWKLVYDGKSQADIKHLWTRESYRDFVMVCDWRWSGETSKHQVPLILPDGSYAKNEKGERLNEEVDFAGDSGIFLRGNTKSQVNIWNWSIGSGEVYGYRNDPETSPEVRRAVTPRLAADNPIGKWNRFIITLKGDRLSVNLNGHRVIEDALLPGIPPEGPIGLQHHGDPIEFASLYIKEL
ncbi:MAG: 3-keto-disaccharide hydrolase [Limisphaerales bacterium]